MSEIFSALVTLAMLVLLQAVLGFDNLLYISLESKRAPEDKQSMVRKTGIGLAVLFRLVLMVVLVTLVSKLQATWFSLPEGGWVTGSFNFHSLIVLFGGVFILYTATKEIFHMMSLEEEGHAMDRKKASAGDRKSV
ncbi:MAG: TerC family protein, partial [Verrucomicrobiales bacterium]